MSTSNLDETRGRYLDALLDSHGTLRLPIGSDEYAVPLQTVFQPLTLRQGPFSFEIAGHETGQSAFSQANEAGVIRARNGAEALAKSALRRMVVLGGPGMGKTTLLKALLQEAIHNAQKDYAAPLPLFISLPDLARSGLELHAYLPNILAELDIDASYTHTLMAAINEGRAFLCLDSLDEVVPAERAAVIAFINREAVRCGGTWVIGSRFTEYKGGQFLHSQFAEWELQPLDETMRLEMAQHLLPVLAHLLHKTPAPSAQDFVETLEQEGRIATWGENPLLFSLTAIVYVQAGMLPGCRATLYHDIVAIMLATRLPDQHRSAELRTLLAEIALQLYQTRGRNFTIAELSALLVTSYPDLPPQERTAMVARILDSGLLDVVAHQTYGFKHQMFQEYLTAVALAAKLTSQDETERTIAWQFAWRKHTYSRWGEILRLCVGVLVQEHGETGSQVAARWLHRLADERNTPDGDVGNLCLVLALGSLREFSSALYTDELAEAVKTLLLAWTEMLLTLHIRRQNGHPSDYRLIELTRDIKMLDLYLVMPTIIWLERVRDHGYQGLDTIIDADYLERIFEQLHVTVPAKVLESAYPNSRGISLYASTLPETLRVYAAMEPLVRLLLDRAEHWRVRTGAAQLLGEWAQQTPIALLCEVLEDTTAYYRIRLATVEALGKQQERIPTARLLPLLQDSDERVRVAIIVALASAGVCIPVEPLLAAVLATLTNTNNRIDYKKLWDALDKLNEQIAVEPLLTALQSENATLRIAALRLLGSRAPVEQVIAALGETNISVVSVAVDIADKLREPALIDALFIALRSIGGNIPRTAESVLVALEAYIPTETLVEALYSDNEYIYVAAEIILKLSGRTVPAEELIALAQEHNMLQRAVSAAKELQIVLPVNMLLAALDLPHYQGADDAAQLLASLGQNAPVATLLNMLQGTSPNACHGAANTLALLAPHVPAEPIFALLKQIDASSDSYHYLVLLLLRKGISIPAELLVNAIQIKWHPGYNQKDPVITALANTDSEAPIEKLLDLVSDYTTVYEQSHERVVQALSSLYEWITPENLTTTSYRRIEDEHLALKVLGAMGKDAPVDLIKSVLDDETRDRWLRSEARCKLQESGINLPLKYFLAEDGMGHEMTDDATIVAMRTLGPQAPIQELLELLISNYDWIHHPSLLERTGSNDHWVHDTVIEALRELVPYLPLETLLEALDHCNPLARKGAAAVLGAFGERAPVNKLIALLHDPKEELVVRAATLRSLAELHPYAPAEALTAVLRDKNTRISDMALWALKNWGRDIPLEPLLELVNDEEYDKRDDAIMALGWLQDRAPLDLLLSLLDGADMEVSDRAAWALSHMGKYTPLDMLIAHLYDNDGDVRTEVLRALTTMGEYAPIELILQMLDHEDPEVRTTIGYQLDTLAEAAPARFVELAKADPRPAVREALMQAIAKLGKQAPIELAIAALEDENEDVRFHARVALLDLDVDPAIVPMQPLLEALREKRSKYDSHWSELGLLAKSGSQAPLEPLLALLGDSNPGTCEYTAEALYKTYPDVFASVARQAEAMLRGEPTGSIFASRVQSRIADRVRLIGRATPAVLELVTDLLNWPYWEVRKKAAQALRAIHRNIPDRAIRRLMELRHDPQAQTVREAADEALAEILSHESGMEEE